MEILTRALRPDHRKFGLTLDEDEDFLYLRHNGIKVATFLAYTITVPALWQACDEYLTGVRE